MVNAPTLYPDAPETSETSLNYFGYYRKRDGWIVSAPAWPMEFAKRQRQGWVPLTQYGTFTPGRKSTDARGVGFDAVREGWRVGFQKGGNDFAREFPVPQIVAYNWHITPPYREVEFPQLAGVEIPSFECPECVRPPLPNTAGLATHLRIKHDYSRVDLREYGKEIGVDFNAKSDRDIAAALEQQEIGQQVAQQTAVDPEFTCDLCDWAASTATKNKAMALATHKRFAHERTRVPEAPAHEGSES